MNDRTEEHSLIMWSYQFVYLQVVCGVEWFRLFNKNPVQLHVKIMKRIMNLKYI